MTFDFTAVQATLLNIHGYMGQVVDYLSRDGLTAVTDISAPLNRSGEDGTALVNLPVALVAAPVFADKITDPDAVEWRISRVLQRNNGQVPCELKRADFWITGNFETCAADGVTWSTHTSGVLALRHTSSSSEVISAEDGRAVEVMTLQTQHLTSITHKMRYKWGSRYLYVTGISPDDTDAKTTIFDVIEEEA